MSDEVMTQEQLSVPYNPNLLVTYKAIPDTYAAPESPTFITEKVTDIEWSLHHGRLNADVVKENNANLIWLEEQIPEWYDPNYSKEEVLRELAEHFKINPVKEINVYGTVTFSGTISIPLNEIEDFDLSNVNVDAEINSYDYDADFTVDDVSVEEN